ncbi:MAG: hypothetical protein ACLFV2_04545 [Desulfurivibrionaceae bacterium]
MNFLLEKITFAFDLLYSMWDRERVHRGISLALVAIFIISLLVIELKRQGINIIPWEHKIPANHFYAVDVAFTVVLVLEVISLIFVLPCSFSRSVGKQFEILTIILLRNAFKELVYFPEPISFTGNEMAVLRILSDGFGALIIFALLGYYYRLQDRYSPEKESRKIKDLYKFVAAKKGLSLVLLLAFLGLGVTTGYKTMTGGDYPDFFHSFYTLLILADVLLVLIGQYFQPSFYSIFRNSGYALSTLIIRIALAAPSFYNVLLGIAAVLFAIFLFGISSSGQYWGKEKT